MCKIEVLYLVKCQDISLSEAVTSWRFVIATAAHNPHKNATFLFVFTLWLI